jgi:serine protease Do
MTIKSKKSFLIIVCLLVIGRSLFANTGNSAKLYSLPIAEMESILSNWLSHSGFRVNPTERNRRKVELTAIRAQERWQIHLNAHSAVATEVWVSPLGFASKNPAMPREMAAYLAGYIKALSVRGDDADQVIPPAVLSQIESIVCIKARRGQQSTQFSGLILNANGLIICTTHNLEKLQEIKVILNDGREFDGNLVKFDARKDLALVRADVSPKRIISLARGRNLVEVGERVFSIGCPVNLIGTVYSGIVNGPPRRVEELPFWQVNMEIHPGSSGSPVFDTDGRLVGIVKGRYRGTTSIGFVIPLETITSFMNGP